VQSERNAPDTKKLVGIKRSGADGKDQEYAEWHYLYGQKLKRKLRRGKQYKSVR
jgi:hypothetical protein